MKMNKYLFKVQAFYGYLVDLPNVSLDLLTMLSLMWGKRLIYSWLLKRIL